MGGGARGQAGPGLVSARFASAWGGPEWWVGGGGQGPGRTWFGFRVVGGASQFPGRTSSVSVRFARAWGEPEWWGGEGGGEHLRLFDAAFCCLPRTQWNGVFDMSEHTIKH